MLWIDQKFKNQGILNAKKGDLQYSKFNTLLWLLIFLNRDSLHARRNKHYKTWIYQKEKRKEKETKRLKHNGNV